MKASSMQEMTSPDLRRFRIRKLVEVLAVTGMVLCAAVSIFFLLAILGYVVYRVTWNALTRTPEQVERKIRGFLATTRR